MLANVPRESVILRGSEGCYALLRAPNSIVRDSKVFKVSLRYSKESQAFYGSLSNAEHFEESPSDPLRILRGSTISYGIVRYPKDPKGQLHLMGS